VSCVHIGKRLKFLADLTRNTDIDGDNIRLFIRHYIEKFGEKLVDEWSVQRAYKISQYTRKFEIPRNLTDHT